MNFKSFFYAFLILLTAIGGIQITTQNIRDYEVDSTIACSEVPLIVDDRVEKYFNQFIRECESRDIDEVVFDKIYENLDEILVIDPVVRDTAVGVAIPKKLWGAYMKDRRAIYINSNIIPDTTKTKVVVYHELAHCVGVKHSCEFCTDIMGAHKKDFTVYNDKDYFEEKLDQFFDQIKKTL